MDPLATKSVDENISLTEDGTNYSDKADRSMCIKAAQYLRKHLMFVATFIGVVLGFAIGFSIRLLHPSEDVLLWIGLPGEIFLRLLILMIVPLIICSVISGTAGLDPRSNGKIASIAFLYIFITNLLGALVGTVMCLAFKPGEGIRLAQTGKEETQTRTTPEVFADLFRNIFPDNIVKATFSQTKTVTTIALKDVTTNVTNTTENIQKIITKSLEDANGTNVIGLIVFSTMIGIATSQLKGKTSVFISLFDGATEVILLLLKWISWLTPLGVLSLITVTVARIADLSETFAQLGLFVAAVTVAVVLQHLIIFPLYIFIITRRNPYAIMVRMVKPWLLVVATTMSAIAIPGMLHVSEEKFKIDRRISRFVIPFSTTISANGSACFVASGAIFLATASGISLPGSGYAIICLLSGITSLAVPSTPSAGIVALLMVLTSYNIPTGAISLLFAVECVRIRQLGGARHFLDRIRSGSNCISHMVCCIVTNQFCRNDVIKYDTAEHEEEKEEKDSPA